MRFFTRCEEKYLNGLPNVLNTCSGLLGEGPLHPPGSLQSGAAVKAVFPCLDGYGSPAIVAGSRQPGPGVFMPIATSASFMTALRP